MSDASHVVPHAHAVVLAGGSGTRFWPLSRQLTPKQLLEIFGTESLICQAIHRIAPFVAEGGLHVLTNPLYAGEIRTHLLAQHDELMHAVEVLAEPAQRNTGPAVALAAAHAAHLDPEAVVFVLPSDHLLEADEGWEASLLTAAELARRGWVVTLGLAPDRPETGYGYIRAGDPLTDEGDGFVPSFEVERFVEKPDRATAERLIADPAMFWNAGIFVFKASTMLAEVERLLPDVASVVAEVASADPAVWTSEEGRAAFERLQSVSIDVGVLERSDRVAVVPARLRWRDVGSFLALAELGEADERANVHIGRVVDVDSRDCIVYAPERLVATVGLSGLVVVDTPDATLISTKDRVQDVRLVTEALHAAGAAEALAPRDRKRPWGGWSELVAARSGYRIKVVEVSPGRRLSKQYHEHRSEHWVVVEGRARIECDGREFDLGVNESTFIPKGAVHRVGNPGEVPLRFIEVQVGDVLDEDDIVRLEDDWKRDGPRLP